MELKKPVSRLASILLGELVAIEIAKNFIQSEMEKKTIKAFKGLKYSVTASQQLASSH